MHFKSQISQGRSESASFLIWYLENYYRLDVDEAVDCVCDQRGDKGVDAIYVNEANGTIDIFQSKISQKIGRTVGDTSFKEFIGTLEQFKSKESIRQLLTNCEDNQLSGLITRLNLIGIRDSYNVRGVFIANMDLDQNGIDYLNNLENISFVGKSDLIETYVSDKRELTDGLTATFTVGDVGISEYHVDQETKAVIAPIKAIELVKIQGISDQSIFAYNVRGPLGKTSVNKSIVKTLEDQTMHKQFPLFHNGITIVTNKIEIVGDCLKIDTFNVVNGCQSLSALYDNKKLLTDDLKVLVKFVQVSVESDLAAIITRYSKVNSSTKCNAVKKTCRRNKPMPFTRSVV